jgi:hypothetical protein
LWSRKFHARQKERRRQRLHIDVNEKEPGDSEDDDEDTQLPIFSYFALVVGYCAIGSALFNAWERGAVWSVG